MFRIGSYQTLGVLLSQGWRQRGLALERLAALLAANPAQRFGLAQKGRLAEGYDADFTLVDLGQTYTLRQEDLFYRHPISPYLGLTFVGAVQETWLRGQRVYAGGKIEKPSVVRLLKRTIPFKIEP